MSDTTFIYALCEPDTGEIRYVGKADDLKDRLRRHLQDKKRCHRGNWIRSILIEGKQPLMMLLDEVSFSEWPQWEVAYIQFFQEAGCDLVNSNIGGIGGCDPSPAVREKISKFHLGKKKSPEARANMSASHKGYVWPEESKRKLSENTKGIKKSEEHKRRIGDAHRGMKRPPGTGAKISEALTGGKLSQTTRERMSASQKARRIREGFYG